MIKGYSSGAEALLAWAKVGTSISRPDDVAEWIVSLESIGLPVQLGVFMHFVGSEEGIRGIFSPEHFDKVGFLSFLVGSEGVDSRWLENLEGSEDEPSVIPVLLGEACDWEIRIPIFTARRRDPVALLAFGGHDTWIGMDADITSFVKGQVRSCMDRLSYAGEVQQLRIRQSRTTKVSASVGRAMHDFVLLVDGNGIVRFASDSHIRLGKDPGRLIGISATSIFHPDDWTGFTDWSRRLERDGSVGAAEFRIQLGCDRCEDGTAWLEVVGSPIDDQEVGGFVVIGRDVTERRSMESALRDSESKYRNVVELAGEGIWQVDWSGRTLFMNRRMSQLLDQKEPNDALLADHLNGDAIKRIGIDGIVPVDFESHQVEVELRTDYGQLIPALLQYRVISDSTGDTSLLMMFADISDLVQSRKELHELARHDSLTGLANRLEIYSRLERSLDSTRNNGVGIFFIDIDDFKYVNDSLGHSGGDELLVELARRLLQSVRSADLVGRLGGDEFVVLTERTLVLSEQRRFMRRILATFEEPFRIGDRLITVNASVGFAASTGLDSPLEVLDRADRDMYRVKAAHG